MLYTCVKREKETHLVRVLYLIGAIEKRLKMFLFIFLIKIKNLILFNVEII